MDDVVVEEPLEIRIGGETVAITMRTPGDDERLVLGFLFSEGIIGNVDDVGTVAHCGRPGEEGYGNVIDVSPGPGVALDTDRVLHARRGTLITSACGICGRRSIADLLERTGRVDPSLEVALGVVRSSTERLRELQPRFDRTGGIHGAAACSTDGSIVAAAEDVGRHNAVDKVIGALLLERAIGQSSLEPPPAVLTVSGRISFEIAQKTAAAGIPVLTGVSAPTSLAIDLCQDAGIALVGFVRDGRLNVYTHAERVGGLPEVRTSVR